MFITHQLCHLLPTPEPSPFIYHHHRIFPLFFFLGSHHHIGFSRACRHYHLNFEYIFSVRFVAFITLYTLSGTCLDVPYLYTLHTIIELKKDQTKQNTQVFAMINNYKTTVSDVKIRCFQQA